MNITYIGENLFVGDFGNFLTSLAFSTAFLASIAYALALKTQIPIYTKIGRIGFMTHAFSILGMVVLMLYMLLTHRFEYYYVWQHSNTQMAPQYIFSSLWEGQEGSFLIWMFWHVVIGVFLIFYNKNWENGLLFVFAAVELFLTSMILGVYIGDYKLGSGLFTLLREHPDFQNLPFLQNPNYLSNIDGRGLNPLLQNYWMTIHPPILFLGFASTLIPFAFAITGLIQKKYTEWITPALPWTVFSSFVLAMGILMGGAWAYEALSFGGFWAWDPVENSSLVPWLVVISALHIMLIYKKKSESLFWVYFFSLMGFIAVLYSTFLTRSGILGESSVHAFTDLGMSGQLAIYLLFFALMAFGLLAYRIKNMPKSQTEDEIWSREFWMLIGSLIILASAFQITFTTSIPVINKILGTNLAPPTDAIKHYNNWQFPFAIVVAFIIGFSLFLRFKQTDKTLFFKQLIFPVILSLVISIVVAIVLQLYSFYLFMLFFASTFAVIGNFEYWRRFQKLQLKKGGAAISHIGFALILIGVLISAGKKTIISKNNSNIDLGKNFENAENIMLIKNDTVQMGNYFVSYRGDSVAGINILYKVDFYKQDGNQLVHQFTLYPRIQTNPRMGNVAEPATKHFFSKDIYTHVTYAELNDSKTNDLTKLYKDPVKYKLQEGDTVFVSNAYMILEKITTKIDSAKYGITKKDIAFAIELTFKDLDQKTYQIKPIFLIREIDGKSYKIPLEENIEPLGLKVNFANFDPTTAVSEIEIREKSSNTAQFIILQAIVFPYINILWIGCFVMFFGMAVAMVKRFRLNSKNAL